MSLSRGTLLSPDRAQQTQSPRKSATSPYDAVRAAGQPLPAPLRESFETRFAKEGVLHELVHVMLINKGFSAVQVWQARSAGVVSGPDEVKRVAKSARGRRKRASPGAFSTQCRKPCTSLRINWRS